MRILRVLAPIAFALGCFSPAPAQQPPPAPAAQDAGPSVRFGDAAEHAYTDEFFPGTTYDAAITQPETHLGVALGSRPAHHAEVLTLWRTWAAQSRRVKLETYARSHEGRELVYGVVTSPENLRNLDSILERIGKLADPRKAAPGEGDAICKSTPAVAWFGYSIHGDEMSGVDGGLALAYHLIAGTSADVTGLLEKLVVVIDPMQNPDGRERFLSMLEQNAGATAVLDGDALSHGRWPGGRGNHYLFDMNRDWIAGVAPETRGRWRAVQRFHPQLFVDAHEMGRDDSYLFYPQADPINPHLPAKLVDWQKRYAAGIAEAFDEHGWSYYTREWADGWGPFYSDSWGSLNGAIGILYEQARYDGQTVKLASGEIATYRVGAHRQATASLANLLTLAGAREQALRDYAEHRRRDTERADLERPYFVVRAGEHASRSDALVEILLGQGIEITAAGSARLRNAIAADGTRSDSLELEGPIWRIDARQPQGALVRAFLEFDTRYPKADLERERRELETKGNSKIYDSTAWNLAHAYDLDAWWCAEVATEAAAGLTAPPARPSGVVEAGAGAHVYGWIVDGADDGSVAFAARAMELGLTANVSDEAFESAGRRFARGSVLVRGHENPAHAAELVERAAKSAGVQAFATASARAPGEGHDLGGTHFRLLARPRVALLSNAPVRSDAFGHVWHQLDLGLALPTALLDAQELSSYDLRRYNVLVLPPCGQLRQLLAPMAEDLQAWVRSGGTLIAMGESAAALANEDLGLSKVRRREDVLADIEAYRFAATRERAGRKIEIDEAALWEGPGPAGEAATSGEGEVAKAADSKAAKVDPDAEREERWKKLFSPSGVFLAADVDEQHWLTAGSSGRLPVFFDGSVALLSRAPVSTALRLAPAAELRLSGLVWPEARERLADTAYLTAERVGHGQVILFASVPGFRGFHEATARLLSNAVVYGPGLGSNQPTGW